ncbi:hypothetical protein BU26DRAFT_600019 [Trematosphaeria pertusa]|uniref:JmjC domain-containing protein n=1 Tax=Trematosphaeria pertusa TaxID=390896 RepID=A0A6A6IWD1_9PLEO|nr:uncharacterized protein BU26DRAFT_600019 [Trematosphaeria pertusa]KAF2254242.1 hypothetical protein BU26DRAFT_600019 [Trematosphaeria pertusa]
MAATSKTASRASRHAQDIVSHQRQSAPTEPARSSAKRAPSSGPSPPSKTTRNSPKGITARASEHTAHVEQDAADPQPCSCTPAARRLMENWSPSPEFLENLQHLIPQLCPQHTQQLAMQAIGHLANAPVTSAKRTLDDLDGAMPLRKVRRVHPSHVASRNDHTPPDHCAEQEQDFKEQAVVRIRGRLGLKGATSSGPPLESATFGRMNNKIMRDLLELSTLPKTSGPEPEIYYLTGAEAKELLESRNRLRGPIVTHGQQNFQWQEGDGQPFTELFDRFGCLEDREVSVQNPSLKVGQFSAEIWTLQEVKEHFCEPKNGQSEFNCLDMASPLKNALPAFLTGPNCALLSCIRDFVTSRRTAGRSSSSVEEWRLWTEKEEWILLAWGDMYTITHTDAMGYNSWLTVQPGSSPVGFGWISNPTEEERREWITQNATFRGQFGGHVSTKLRYKVVYPGQTVCFAAGTIHFVFRLAHKPTFVIGGHFLRWSDIDSWIRVVISQYENNDSTNEEVVEYAPQWVNAVAALVQDKVKRGLSEQLGGTEPVERFREGVRDFQQLVAGAKATAAKEKRAAAERKRAAAEEKRAAAAAAAAAKKNLAKGRSPKERAATRKAPKRREEK